MDNLISNGIGDSGIIVLLLFFLFMGQNGWGNNRATATADDVYNATAQQSNVNSLNEIKNGISASTYETANLVNGVNNNLNMLGSNIVNNMTHGFDNVSAQINNLGYQMSQCCCDLKSQMLQDKYEAVSRELANASNIISNQTQTQTILSNMGRWYPYQGINPLYGSGSTFI